MDRKRVIRLPMTSRLFPSLQVRLPSNLPQPRGLDLDLVAHVPHEVRHRLLVSRIARAQYAHGENGCVCRIVDSHGSDRAAARHLDDRKQAIVAV